MQAVVDAINSIVWSYALIGLILVVGIYFTFSTRFIQIRHFKEMIKRTLDRSVSKNNVSSYQALLMSIAGRVGIGNIAGVATAIGLGGPGAIFWMWVMAFIGMATSFFESTLGQIFKEKVGDEFRGGPAYYLSKGLGKKWVGSLFAITIAFAYGFLLTGIQANGITASFSTAFNIKPIFTAVFVCILVSAVIFGGVKRFAKFSEVVVPFMALAYILIALIIVVMNISQLPDIIALIFSSAFGTQETFGGLIGAAIAWGVKRGIYSNEAGQGTAPHAASTADVSHPIKQGLVQGMGVFIDTVIVCSATAFMILITGKYNVENTAGGYIVNQIGNVEIGVGYTQLAVDSVFQGFGNVFVAIAVFFFAVTTLLFIAYVAETNIVYIFGDNAMHKNALRIIVILSTFYGGMVSANLIWSIADIGVGLITWINVIGIFLLRKPVLRALKDYEQQKALGVDPVFNPTKLGIKNATFWEDRNKEINQDKNSDI
ncbi:alanine:cation symporter family protein [Lysinibacillus agricola]|uniref:Alanine:cation symporter family protein n=1 Tax=Lysinibacillus agricola TaxID=2590012 RepID=A0ABX7AR70_9BACI|nr:MULTISPECIES: alanine/glycine:cation symporter family protein [Lysinibacillus]KOS61659.1 sodium:alanine symporter [Lysinibacillus sp. FJAT-14222]QQP12324.1 alanine:cation symporter family protein [Lysinibacillus agricola]